MKKIFVGVATLALTMGAFSCTGDGTNVTLKTQDDSIAYAIGILQSQGLSAEIERRDEAVKELEKSLEGLTGSQLEDKKKELESLKEETMDREMFLKGFREGLKDSKKFSYYAGGITASQMAPRLKKDSLNIDAVLAAFNAVVKQDSANIQLNDSTARALMQSFQTKQEEKARLEAEAKVNVEKEKGIKFIEEFKKEEGVQTTESGLAYKVLTAGTGAMPTKDDKVKVNYKGTLIDGTEFDANEGIEFGVTQVVPGWTEMLQLMKVGEKVKVAIPSDLAYGNQGNYKIPGGSTLVFEMELVDIVKGEKK